MRVYVRFLGGLLDRYEMQLGDGVVWLSGGQ